MHESSLARQILSVVLDAPAVRHRAAVLRVRAWVAETEALSGESVTFHFAALARDTCAAGAWLELDVRRVGARCVACAVAYLPDHHVLLCPECGSAEGELLGETGVGVDEIELRVEDDV
jgi:hydrogenase nickel incorporation protein HypA/HybF